MNLLWPNRTTPVIGMVHLLPLPGAPRFDGDLASVERRAVADAAALTESGVDGLIVENYGDAPFYPGRVPAETVAHITALAARLKREFDVPLGVNVLRNDGQAALVVAQAAGAEFIRVNVLCGARLTDQGLIEGAAHDLLRLRARIGAGKIQILADVDVKHSAPLAERPLEDEVLDLIERGGADGLIVSGSRTGSPACIDHLRRVKRAAGDHPVFIGSGVDLGSVEEFARASNGLIVGTALKGADGAIDRALARRLVEAAR